MIPVGSVIISSRVLIVNPLDSSVKFATFLMRKMTRNPKMHVVVRENDVNYVKNSFESKFSAKNGNLTMKKLFLAMTT